MPLHVDGKLFTALSDLPGKGLHTFGGEVPHTVPEGDLIDHRKRYIDPSPS